MKTALLTAAICLLAGRAAAQDGWRAVSRSQADLWFHGVALVGFQGFGAGELYDPRYSARVRQAKSGLGVESELDRSAPILLDAFRSDSTFEVMHFVPLYFGAAGRLEMLDALKGLVTDPEEAVEHASPAARFGTAAVAAVLTTPEQLRILGQFISALESEWSAFYREYRSDSLAGELENATAATQQWLERMGNSLEPYLGARKLSRGLLVISPAVGSDGRLFAGDPQQDGDNLVVVGPAWGEDGAGYRALREWCFPAGRAAVSVADPAAGRHQAEMVSGRAAVHCGAMLLRRVAPQSLAAYYRAFGVADLAGLEAIFPLGAGLSDALKAEIP